MERWFALEGVRAIVESGSVWEVDDVQAAAIGEAIGEAIGGVRR